MLSVFASSTVVCMLMPEISSPRSAVRSLVHMTAPSAGLIIAIPAR
jgi:hypothetical protein